MSQPTIAPAAAFALCVSALFAHAEAPHVHGLAELEIAVDGGEVTLLLTSPLDNLLGFERAPKNDKEIAAVRKMAQTLRRANLLFALAPAARCSLLSVSLASPTLPPDLLNGDAAAAAAGEAPGANASQVAADEHTELSAEYRYRCDEAGKLGMIEMKLFDAFSGIERLKVASVSARGQAAAELTSQRRRHAL